ncbi:ABC transporter ATP-binding protein [Halostella sp. JP-L12]|uniref:ABC transporter ATP-binding protein n=1 Tax=Halostella TaxID=1843185 RepID=UPI000EF83AB8|nr:MULTISPECIES: ABC transporter ATP-binding protein [Halostella]NHN46204.1 ABC transporter ATP-binding protein [Halostella sp. JP-L12]
MVDLSLDGVSKRYGDATALAEVDLRVADGEFFTLVGPSGCGKTTTLRLVAGFETPTTGAVRFGGHEMTGVPPEDRDVGIVFQSYALFPHMSVAENVAYGLRFRDPPAGQSVDERVSELLDLVDLPGTGDRDPDELSGGQQQRVALARALAPEPDLLLLDEPMSALDARLRERLRRQVKRIQSELGITTLYVTHDQEEALAVSDRVAVMNEGRVEQVGTPQEVYRRPETRFVAEFVGENNAFDGRVAGHDGETTSVAVGDADLRIPRVDAAEGESVTFCVRPEALSVVDRTTTGEADGSGTAVGGPAAQSANRLTAEVEYAEFLGEAVRVHATWNGRDLVVRLPDDPDADELTVGFDPAAAHVVER